MKRYMADRYANTNIMRPDNLQGIEERAQAFLKKCLETNASQGDTDVYVRKWSQRVTKPYMLIILLDPSALLRPGWRNT